MMLRTIVVAVALMWQGTGIVAPAKNPADLPITDACSWVARNDPDLKPLARVCVSGHATNLPNFVCRVRVARRQPLYINSPRIHSDVVTGEVTYRDGVEEFNDVRVDGKPAGPDDLVGNRQWAQGEFTPPGWSVLSGVNNPVFRFDGKAEEGGRALLAFSYTVAKKDNNSWGLNYATGTYYPAFTGKLEIEKDTGLPLRFTREAIDLESTFPFRLVAEEVNYDKVKIEGLGEFVLPVRARFESCQRGGMACAENTVDYQGCRKFGVSTKITSY